MKVLFVLLLLAGLCFAQQRVVVTPNSHDWVEVFNDTIGTSETTTAFSAKQWEGVTTLCIEADTTVSTLTYQSDSCMTVGVQYYCGSTNIASWGPYYNAVTASANGGLTNFTKIDTIARGVINKSTSVVFMNIPDIMPSYAWADSARIVVNIGNGDSLIAVISAGGQ